MKNFKIIIRLFLTFLKIGAFTFGGGYAMIPLITQEAVHKNKWIEEKDILDIVAVAESTPGPAAVNSATFVGYRTAGFAGAAAATFGVVLPSFMIIFVIAEALRQLQDLRPVRYAFMGIRAGVLALIIRALISMYRQCPKGMLAYIIMGVSFLLAAALDINVLVIIAGCALCGIVQSVIVGKREEV